MPDRVVPCRLAFLIRDLGHGGAQRQLVTLARALVERDGFEITVVHFYPGPFEGELQAAGVRTMCIGKRHRWDLAGFFIRLVKTMRGLHPDVIHGYLHESNLMALLLKPLCGFPKVIWGIRDSQTDADTWGLLGKLSFRLNCLLSGWADTIIANSRAGRDYYIAHGYPAAKFEVVPNGIDTARFANKSLGHAGNVFAMIGRLHPMKDHATFLRALALVPGANGRIIGNGDATYQQQMQSLAQSLGLTDRVTWEKARDDLPSLYPTLDCVVSTSAYGEGFSNVLGEAMAFAVPCIASDVGDSAWLLEDENWVFPAGDVNALAEKLRAFQTLALDQRQALGEKNHQRILAHFTVEKMVERTALLVAPSLVGTRCAGSDLSASPGRRFDSVPSQGSAPPLPPIESDPAQRVPTKVLWLTTGLGTGGAEMMLTQLIGGLKNQSHTVISLTSGGKYVEPLRALGVTVHSLDMPAGKPTPAALWKLFKLARQARPDVLMGWMYHGCLAAMLARVAVRARVIWNIRQSLYDLSLEKRGSALVIRALTWLSQFVEAITYNSQISARQHETIGYRRTKTRLIPNGFDLSRWAAAEGTSKSVASHAVGKNELGSSLFIGRFGRYTAMKDYPTFLEAAALIVGEFPQTQFLLVGTHVDETNAELMNHILRLGLKDNVKLLGERHDLPSLTASLDIAVSSSAFGEGFPNVVGEAMACGIPVVATDIGDTAWVMGDTGQLVPAKNAAALAAACLATLRLSSEERRILGHAGRERIEQYFSLGSVLVLFDELLMATDASANPAGRSACITF